MSVEKGAGSAGAARMRIEVSAGLVFHAGKLLIAQRPRGVHLEGFWEFPGGKRHPDESGPECLVRELREELGIDVEVGGKLETVSHDYPEKAVRIEFYRCRWTGGELRAIGCAGFKWVGPVELAEHKFPPADTQLIRALAGSCELWD